MSISCTEKIELIRGIIEDLASKMDYVVTVEVKKTKKIEEEKYVCDITTETNSNFLIGQQGKNLHALEIIIRSILHKKCPDRILISIDVNGYKMQKNRAIVESAYRSAEIALRDHRPVIMEPMSAFDRRIVHLALEDNKKIITESIGTGEERKVVIKPAEDVL